MGGSQKAFVTSIITLAQVKETQLQTRLLFDHILIFFSLCSHRTGGICCIRYSAMFTQLHCVMSDNPTLIKRILFNAEFLGSCDLIMIMIIIIIIISLCE